MSFTEPKTDGVSVTSLETLQSHTHQSAIERPPVAGVGSVTPLFARPGYVPVVISLCDLTGNMVRPWAEAGCECWCVDIQHSIRKDRTERVGPGWIHYAWGDVRSWRLPVECRGRVIALFGFPPCPHLTCTAARDFIKKGGWLLADAVQLFDSCEVAATFLGAPYMIENPATNRLNTHRRKPDYRFHPWQYAGYLEDIETDNTSKETGLWCGNGFVMPVFKPAPSPHRQDCWMASPSDDRANTRSATPMGFSKAVFLSNRHRIITQYPQT